MDAKASPNPVLHHVTLKTNRVQEMMEWYATVVGMTTNHYSQFGAWLTNDPANHRMALLAHPALSDDPDKVPHTGLHHLAFEYANVGQLMDSYARLKQLGIVPHACLDHGMTTSLYYMDPTATASNCRLTTSRTGRRPATGCGPPPSSRSTRSASASTPNRC
jgi:catechol-2,3-dioxygenase